jgi:DNA-binding CsgD family transcriptional regulator
MLRCHADAEKLIDALARSAHDGALLVIGDVGSGKSTMLSAVLEQHPDTASIVRVNPGESGWPLSGISAIVAGVGDQRAAAFTGRFALRADDDAALGEAAAELLALLRGLALPRTLLLVDDVDRMDAASRSIMGYMAGHLAGSGIRLVATAAELQPGEPLAGIPSVRLGRMDETDAASLAPAGMDAGTLRILASAAGGNLGTYLALLDSLSDEQLAGRDPVRLPARPGPPAWAALERTTRRLGAAHSEVLERLATALLHARSAIVHWSPDAEDALQELLDLGIAREVGAFVGIADPLVRSALADASPSRVRRELHGELARTCGPLLIAWHASWADPSRELRRPLLDAAAEAARLGHPEASVEFADRAVRSGRDGLATALAVLADELLTAGESELADRYLRMAAADRDVDPSARVRLEIARLRADYLAGRPVDAQEAPPTGAAPGLTLHWAATRAAVAAARGEFDDARAPLAHLEREPDLQAPDAARSTAAVARALLSGGTPHPEAFDDGERDPLLLALHARAAVLAEDYAGAKLLIARLAHTLVRPSRMWAGWLTSLAVDCAVRAGRIGEALELARDWGARNPGVTGPPGLVPVSAWAHLADDDLDGADAVLAAWTDHGTMRVGPLPTARGLLMRAELARLRADEDAACELLLLADAVAAPFADPALARHLPELVEGLVAVGRMAAAQRAAARLAAGAETHPTRWAQLSAARSAVATATESTLRERFDVALALHRPDDSGFELGRLLLGYARRLDEAGAAHEAARARADARIAFTRAGARAWAAAVASGAAPAGRPTDESGGRASLLATLSPEERAVVELVVRGLHNKEIAATLYLSVRTVELRLTRIYRKVGARSRAHLVSLMS